LVRTDIKTHLAILKILELIFELSSLCTQSIVDESFLFTSLTLLVSILLNYFPNINNDSQLYSIVPMKIDPKDLQLIELITTTVKLLQEFIKLCGTNQSKINCFTISNYNKFDLDIQKFVPVFLHLFLSISFIILSTKFNQQQSLLSQLFPSIEDLFHTPLNKTISHGAINTVMNLRANRKFISSK
jgi:hypothetical protein